MRDSIIYDQSCFKFEGDHLVTLDKRGRFVLPKVWAEHVGEFFVLGVDQDRQRLIGTTQGAYIQAQGWLEGHEDYKEFAEWVPAAMDYALPHSSSGRVPLFPKYKDVFLGAAEPKSSDLMLRGHGAYFSGVKVGLSHSTDVPNFDPFISMCEEALSVIDHSLNHVQSQIDPVRAGV